MTDSRRGLFILLGFLGIASSGQSSLRERSSHVPEIVLNTYKVGIGLVESHDLTKLHTSMAFQSLLRGEARTETSQTRRPTLESSSAFLNCCGSTSPSPKLLKCSLGLADTSTNGGSASATPGKRDFTTMSQHSGAKNSQNNESPRAFRHILRGGADPECLSVGGTPVMKELWERAKRSPVKSLRRTCC